MVGSHPKLVWVTPEEQVRAGAAVAQRINVRSTTIAAVAKSAQIDPRTLRALITGTRWPTSGVRRRIEKALGWAGGELMRQAQDGLPALAAYSDDQLLAELLHRARQRQRATGQ